MKEFAAEGYSVRWWPLGIEPVGLCLFLDDEFRNLTGSGPRRYGTRGKGARIFFFPKILLFR